MANIEVDMPKEPLFVGSYERLQMRYDPAELKLSDMAFIMSDGLASGHVSVAQESVDVKEGNLPV